MRRASTGGRGRRDPAARAACGGGYAGLERRMTRSVSGGSPNATGARSRRDAGGRRERRWLEVELGHAGEARCARPGEVRHEVDRLVRRLGDAEDRPLRGRVRHAVGEVASGRPGFREALRVRPAEDAGVCLVRAEHPAGAGHARAAGGEGVQVDAQRAVEQPTARLGRAVVGRVLGGGVPGGGVGGAGSAGVRSRVAARRAAAAAGRGPALALRAGRGPVAGQVDAGDERYVHAGGSGRGIARPARVGRDGVDDAGREGGNRRVRDRQGRPEEAALDGLARAGRAAAIRVRRAARVWIRAGTGAAGPAAGGAETRGPGGRAAAAGPRVDAVARCRARSLRAIAIGVGPVAGDERVAGADAEVGGGSGRGGARRDAAASAAADVQTGGAKVVEQRRAAGVGVSRA